MERLPRSGSVSSFSTSSSSASLSFVALCLGSPRPWSLHSSPLFFGWWIQTEWQDSHFTTNYATLALGWQAAFFLVFFAYPFFTTEDRKALPWAISALAGPLQFILIYDVLEKAFPAFKNGFAPG